MANPGTLKDNAKDSNAKEAIFKEKTPRETPAAAKTKMLNTRIPKDLIKRLKVYCVENEITMQDCITQMIQEKLGQEDTSKE